MNQLAGHLDWVPSTNIYEVNLRQYTPEGTIAAFRNHLPRLKEMGVEVLWFMPLTPISEKNRKGELGSYYSCSSYVKMNPEFGTIEEFQSLVDEIHALKMKVIIDWVANHTGWDHEWTLEYPDFYSRDWHGNFKPPVDNWEDVIHLNYNNAPMRKAMIDAMAFWVHECGIDGFRCDMAMLVPVDFWKEARTALDQIRPLFWLGEFDQWGDEPYAEVFDASYTWHWMHIAEEYYQKHRKLFELDKALSTYQTKKPYRHIRSFFTSNHDENSWNGSEYEKYGDMALPLAVFSCTWNGVPMIYSGQELPSHKRLLFFDKDEISWNDQPALHRFYKTLLEFRKKHPALNAADKNVITWRIATSELDALFSYVRKCDRGEVVVVLNFSDKPIQFHFADQRIKGEFQDLFSGATSMVDSITNYELEPWGYLVLFK